MTADGVAELASVVQGGLVEGWLSPVFGFRLWQRKRQQRRGLGIVILSISFDLRLKDSEPIREDSNYNQMSGPFGVGHLRGIVKVATLGGEAIFPFRIGCSQASQGNS